MATAREITLRANGLEFTATSVGEGPVVLCLHGFPDHRNTFRHQFDALVSAGYRVVAPTLRGYEPSSQPSDKDYHVVRMAEDVLGWIAELDAEKVHLVGHDWGAIISYSAAALAPERMHSITTIAVPHVGGIFRHGALRETPRQILNSWYILFFQLPWLPEALLSREDWSFVETLWRRWSPGWEPPRDAMQAVKQTLARPGVKAAALAYYRSLTNAGKAARATMELQQRPQRVPTMAITGSQDGCIDTTLYDVAMQPRDFPAGLVVRRIQGAGHFVHQERPDVVNSLLLDWLAEHSREP